MLKPKLWEDRLSLYCAALVHSGIQCSTLRSYCSAIKTTLVTDGYVWDDSKELVSTLARACRTVNDRIKTRFPMHIALIELFLFELQRHLANQPYLAVLYKAFYLLAYYGLFRPDELAMPTGNHAVQAKDIHIAMNKNKMLFILYHSKTHGAESRP